MTEKTIDHIIYRLKKSKEETQKGAIVLLGAGCSISGGIPSAAKLVSEILESSKENPDIKNFCDEEPNYADLMECLNARERNAIFKRYVDKASINASHIYLAQLMKEGFVDYIVTVNFDNLAQRALALYNIFPPVYDISILRDITTTSLETQSIIHLHGHYNGLWQLNTKEEMQKVNVDGVAKSIFDRITHDRPWIVVGYSGDDFIFDELIKYKRFDNDLFWIGYKDNDPSENVSSKLLNQPNCGACLVRGHDSDAFFLSLSTKLCDGHPKIFSSPFSFLSDLYENIVDIEDGDKYKLVKERFEDSKKNVSDAIQRYEKGVEIKNQMSKREIQLSQLKQELIECIVEERDDDIPELENKIKKWGGDALFPQLGSAYFNWGNHISNRAKILTGKDKEELFLQACNKYETAVKYKTSFFDAYNNWGNRLFDLAEMKNGDEREKLILDSILKYETGIQFDDSNDGIYANLGSALFHLSKLRAGKVKEELVIDSCIKYETAVRHKNDIPIYYHNWCNNLIQLSKLKTKDAEALKILKFALEKALKCKELGGKAYNLSCVFALLKNKNEAFHTLEESLQKQEVDFEYVEADEDWDNLREEPEYLRLKEKYGVYEIKSE